MDDETRTWLDEHDARIIELETIIRAHRALISQHHSALQTVAQIMEVDRHDDPLS